MTDLRAKPVGSADLLMTGFGTTAVMWAIGYACRLFGDAVPPAVVFSLLMACLLASGFVVGRVTHRGVLGGVLSGLLTGLLNLLVVGSLIGGRTPYEIKHGALAWVLGTPAVCAVICALGAFVGCLLRPTRDAASDEPTRPPPDWPGLFALVAVGATFLLLGAGGLVTGFDEGLAVVDWPNTEGYNMFLYPLARMTGGVYLEHSHRLLGSLVGLTTLVLALHTQFTAQQRSIKRLAWLALAMVVVQGILGGLRVTGRFTLSTQAVDTDPSIILAIVHGVFGQLVFAALVALAVARSRRWMVGSVAVGPAHVVSANTDRVFGSVLVAALIVQLVLGALVRHFSWALDVLRYGLNIDPARLIAIGKHMLNIHIAFAAMVASLCVVVGVRAWGIFRSLTLVRRLGGALLWLILAQVTFGVTALVVTGNNAANRRPTAIDVSITTVHQLVGAALLACAVAFLMWIWRISSSSPAAESAAKLQTKPL